MMGWCGGGEIGCGKDINEECRVYLFNIMGLVSEVAAFSFFSIVEGEFFGGFI